MTTPNILRLNQTVCFVRNMFYTEGMIKNKGGLSVVAQRGVGVWTSQCDISSIGNMTTKGTITSAGLIKGLSLSITGESTVAALKPSVAGVRANYYAGYAFIDLAGASNGGGFIDFTTAGTDMKGRMLYRNSSSQFEWNIADNYTAKMTLQAGGLYLGGTLVSASDKRLKFNEQPLINALTVINKLEPVEYDQTFDLVEHYTPEAPQSHRCGFIAQSVEKIEELKHIVEGGEIGEDGKESLRGINYNAIFTYAGKAIQELSQIVKAQQVQIDELREQLQNHLLTNSATIIS
jgi:hypothetical protein